MRGILTGKNRGILRRFARSNVLLAFDYDGTLAPIVSDPGRATMRATTRRLLRQLTRLYPCIIISGRALADARRLLRGVDVLAIFGNHGAETSETQGRGVREVQGWQLPLENRLKAYRGVRIENNGYSIVVHYRQSPEKKKALAAILEAVAGLGAVRVTGGKLAVNVLPRNGPNKGTALKRERARLGCDTAIYVGDDDSDEDVFALKLPGKLLAIRVGAKVDTRAPYCIRNQAEIDRLLALLVGWRASDSTANERARAPRAVTRRSLGSRTTAARRASEPQSARSMRPRDSAARRRRGSRRRRAPAKASI